jgi:hypothetical protein
LGIFDWIFLLSKRQRSSFQSNIICCKHKLHIIHVNASHKNISINRTQSKCVKHMEIETFLSFNEKSGGACPLGNVFGHFYFIFTTVMKILVSCTENRNFFIKVLNELRLFIDKKVIFSKKKIRRFAIFRLPSGI